MYIQIIGVLIIVCALVFGGYLLVKVKDARKGGIGLAGLGVFAGIVILISDRITELTFGGVGTIKAATAQATSDAGTISALKVRVEDQSATVDAIAKEAGDAADLSNKVSAQIVSADKKLAQLDAAIVVAKTTLASLQADSAFSTTVEEAQNDDRVAFDKLHTIALDPQSPYAIRAAQAWNAVLGACRTLVLVDW
jgi:protein-disulfide isomerase